VRRRRIRILGWVLLLAVLLPAVPASAATPPFLVRYSFDDGLTATGPDTFTVFRNAKGSVQLSTAFHVSGYRSLEIRDVAGDGDFPELEGFFPERREGRLFLHFALLVANPQADLNIALAGPSRFVLTQDGLALWLTLRGGVLQHVSDSIPKRLLTLKAFTWYAIDVDYDVARGRYDLTVAEEGNPKPVVDLKDQPSASNHPGAAVNVFSFIGDLTDKTGIVYYLDDVVLGSDPDAKRPEFVAPGRRKFFVDLFAEQASEFRKLRQPGSPLSCPPILNLAEAGLSRQDLFAARTSGSLETLEALLAPGGGNALGPSAPPKLQAVALWKAGCSELAKGQAEVALKAFDAASRLSPDAGIFELSRLLALTALKRWPEVDDLLVGLHTRWSDDPRYALASALIAAQRGDLGEARAWLDPAAGEALRREPPLGRLAGGDWSDGVISALRSGDPEGWKRWRTLGILSEQSFHLAMLERRTADARDYALQMAKRLAEVKAPAGAWLERAGDAAFARRDLAEARQLYGQAQLNGAREASVLLKLADVHYLLGDLAAEKALREKFYGSLDPK
jgi:tetratricopeptide (TPR) repeat protein